MAKTSFWKYFWNILIESKWLLLRYFVVGIYLVIVGVITNRLQLNDLTYYNALITVCFFGEMIAFGFIEGFGMYINQRINDKTRAIKYARIGLYFTTFTILIIVILLGLFPNFILTNILSLEGDLDLSFYYLMLVALVFITIFSYIISLLKKLGQFKFQLIATIVQCLLITLSLILVFTLQALSLIYIGIIYIVSYILCILCGHICLKQNTVLPLNIFKFTKLKLSKHEFATISYRAFSEVLWETGYFFLALFILKVDVMAYNQYCYFENALDILNSLFFAFVSVVSIKICRSIGEEKIEEAKMNAKYSFIATFVLWGIYALLSLALYIPIKAGLNAELQDTAFICMILYLIIYLFRFVEWNLGTYILGQSEYFAKAGFILELIFTLYWIALFILGDLIPSNIFAIYGLIAFENIVKIIISLFVYKNPKWLNKSN